ncbi:endonuclease, partial [Paenibacillus sp. CFBP13512]
MIIHSIIIYDYIDRKINKFNFESQTNIFVSKSNTVGKSSLMKSIYYCLGYSVKSWPTNWNIQNMMFQIKISNREREHIIIRNKNLF